MSPLHQREMGLVGAGLFFEDVFLEIIGDGAHVVYPFVELVFRLRQGKNLALISDNMCSSYQDETVLRANGLVRENGVLRDGKGFIAGGETLLPAQIRKLALHTSIPLSQLVAAATRNPCRFFDIQVGARDFIVLSADFKLIFQHRK